MIKEMLLSFAGNVLDDELKAYVVVSSDVKNKETGDILGVPAFQMLIDIASME